MYVQTGRMALVVNIVGMYIMLCHVVLEDKVSHNTVCESLSLRFLFPSTIVSLNVQSRVISWA
jgi:hypothetical protein